MAYAQGKHALGICDRCGQQYMLKTLRKEWTGFKVCIECYEPKHPQLEPRRSVGDAIALREPRPDLIVDGARNIQWSWNPVGGARGEASGLVPNSLAPTAEVGIVTVQIS